MNASLDSRRIQGALWFAAFVVAYWVAYGAGMAFGRATASPFWFPDAVLLCALLTSKPRYWWIFVFATLPIRLLTPLPVSPPLWATLVGLSVDSIKVIATALILRRVLVNPLRFQTVRELLVFIAVAVIGVPATAAFAGAAIRAAEGYPYWPAWDEWFLGDALAQLIVTPVILYWVFGNSWRRSAVAPRRVVEGTVLLAGLLVGGYLATNTVGYPAHVMGLVFYAPGPFMLWAAIRFGMRGATGAIAVVAFLAVAAAMAGHGAFAVPVSATVFALQSFLIPRAASIFVVAILIEQSGTAERALRESEERFRLMAHNAPMLLWMAGPDKLCTFFNQGWLDFTGRTLAEELGDGWAEGVHPKDLPACVEAYHAAFDARRPFEIEYRLRRHDGEYRWIVDRGVPRYGDDGEFAGYIGSGIDIGERKRAEETNRALEHAQRLAVIGELTAAIAHEVRQPMSAIQLDAQTVERLIASPTPSLDELRDIAASIRSNVQRVDSVISRIRGFLRRQDTEMRVVDINAVVLDVLWLAGSEALRRDVQIRMDLDHALPPVLADRIQLQQVLLNLVVNAIQAMEGMESAPRELIVRTLLSADRRAEIAITDRGHGIASEHMARLFESFFTTREQGMGLGLAIARSIVEAHRGEIWAENTELGATFHVVLPFASQPARAVAV